MTGLFIFRDMEREPLTTDSDDDEEFSENNSEEEELEETPEDKQSYENARETLRLSLLHKL